VGVFDDLNVIGLDILAKQGEMLFKLGAKGRVLGAYVRANVVVFVAIK
jgi:hypothetical protein